MRQKIRRCLTCCAEVQRRGLFCRGDYCAKDVKRTAHRLVVLSVAEGIEAAAKMQGQPRTRRRRLLADARKLRTAADT